MTVLEIDNPDQERAEEAFGGPVKKCRDCLEWLPYDAEFYWRDSRTRDGFMTNCKVCWRERNRKWDKPRPNRVRARKREENERTV